jgi:NAD(P)-dependent dehydrogenase (short-subunit alcohol dehydrogenase family)
VTSKTALIRFSECLAFEVKDHGIAVFAMGPGLDFPGFLDHPVEVVRGVHVASRQDIGLAGGKSDHRSEGWFPGINCAQSQAQISL